MTNDLSVIISAFLKLCYWAFSNSISVFLCSFSRRGDKVFAFGEDSHALRLTSELVDLRAVNANLQLLRNQVELEYIRP